MTATYISQRFDEPLAQELRALFWLGQESDWGLINAVLAAALPQHWVRSSEYDGHGWELVTQNDGWQVVSRAYGKDPLGAFVVMLAAHLESLGRPHSQLSSIASRLLIEGRARSLNP